MRKHKPGPWKHNPQLIMNPERAECIVVPRLTE